MSVQCCGGEICLQHLNALYGDIFGLFNTGIDKGFPDMNPVLDVSSHQSVNKMSQIGRCATDENVGITG